jgi:hypothetical protein
MKKYGFIFAAMLSILCSRQASTMEAQFIENWIQGQDSYKSRFIEYNPSSDTIDIYPALETKDGKIYNEFRHRPMRPQNPALFLLIGSSLTATAVAGSGIYGINKLKNYLNSKYSQNIQEHINSGAFISEIILAGGGAIAIAGLITLYREYHGLIDAERALIKNLNTPVITLDKTGLRTNGLHKVESNTTAINKKATVNWQDFYDIQEKSSSFSFLGKDGNTLFETKLYTQCTFLSTYAFIQRIANHRIYDIPSILLDNVFQDFNDQKIMVSEQDLNNLIQHYLLKYGNETIKEKLKSTK